MTKEEIRDLEPGQELDKIISRVIMGDGPSASVPPYSTDLETAWKVLDKFEWVNLLKGQVGLWTCTVRLYQGIAFKEYQALARKAPEAICKAALFAAAAAKEGQG